MTVLKLALLIGVYGSLILIPISKGAYVYYKGECPSGRKVLDTWPWIDYCSECICHLHGYSCGSCWATGIVDNCYYELNIYAHYPECCPSTLICKGDPNFNQTKYDIHLNQIKYGIFGK